MKIINQSLDLLHHQIAVSDRENDLLVYTLTEEEIKIVEGESA